MTKYSTILIAVVFLCGSLGYTTSQENLPNVEEVLHKVSNVVDLNSLNLSKGIDLNAFNSSVKQVLEDTKNVFKQKCDKNGGEGAFNNAQSAKDNLEQCFKSFINFTQLEEEMEKKKPTGDLDMVFKEYCRKTPILKKCVSNFTTAIGPCLEPEERENKKIIQNITDSLLNFVCYKEGDRIALFISANGPECLQSKQQEIQHCIDSTLQGYISQLDFKNDSFPGLNSFPPLVFGTKECTDISNIQSCVVRELEKCSDPTPANIVDSILNFIRKVTPCRNVMTFQNSMSFKNSATSSFTVSLLTTISVVFSLLRLI